MVDNARLDEVLGRAALAAERVTTYRGILGLWRDRRLFDEAVRQQRRLHPPGYHGFDDPPLRAPAAQSFEGFFSIACRLPDRPLTRHVGGGDWVSASGPDRSSMQQRRFVGALGDGTVAAPVALMAGCQVGLAGPSIVAARSTTRVDLRFRPSSLNPSGHTEWSGAGQRLIDIDNETGLALRCEDRFGGAIFEVCAFRSIEVGIVLSHEDLTTDLRLLAPDEFIRTEEPVSLEIAAGMVDYKLLIPSRAPSGCTPRCQVRRDATLIQYVAEDGRFWLIVEVEPSSSPSREDLTHFEQLGTADQPIYLWDSPTGPWGRTELIVERDGSRARLTSPIGREGLIEMGKTVRPYR